MARLSLRFAALAFMLGALASCRGGGADKPAKPPLAGSEQTTHPRPPAMDRHAQFMEVARRGGIDLLFIGDSITDFWRDRGLEVWNATWAPLKAANFGINGERVEQTLWRVENGELDGYQAKTIVVMIGTNNLKECSDEAIADGIKVLCAAIQKHQPAAKLLLLGIFPRSEDPKSHWRPRIKAINAEIAKLDDGKQLFYMDIGDKFLEPDGKLTTEIMYDGLHPTEKGYQIWADATLPKVKALMGKE